MGAYADQNTFSWLHKVEAQRDTPLYNFLMLQFGSGEPFAPGRHGGHDFEYGGFVRARHIEATTGIFEIEDRYDLHTADQIRSYLKLPPIK